MSPNPVHQQVTQLSYAEWDAELTHVGGLCDAYSMDTPDGRVLNPATCPGPLAAKYAALLEHGLERGWLTLDNHGQPTKEPR